MLRHKFNRMGLFNREIVAIIGAHTVGFTHEPFSGFPTRPWGDTPHYRDTRFFEGLLLPVWVKRTELHNGNQLTYFEREDCSK
jgi:catalase (peroxidase I)